MDNWNQSAFPNPNVYVWPQYTTAGSTNITVPSTISVSVGIAALPYLPVAAPSVAVVDADELAWLRREVNEVCDLARAA